MKEKITSTAFQYKNRAGDTRYLHQKSIRKEQYVIIFRQRQREISLKNFLKDMKYENILKLLNCFCERSRPVDIDDLINRFGRYQAVLQFTLVDNEKRHFFAERWCFR